MVVLIATVACRPPPPEPLVHDAKIEHDEPRDVVRAEPVLLPRPDIDVSGLVPDPTHELRWPLSMASHPELEPQFEVARALAGPGLDWIALCRLGAHRRQAGRELRDQIA